MTSFQAWKYRVERRIARCTVETAAVVTLGRMPPFVSAAAIVVRQDKVLMVRDAAQSMLVLPGGHLRWNESVEDGLRREVFEETGYRIQPGRVFDAFAGSSGLSDRGIIRVIVVAGIVGGVERSSPEGTVEWVSFEALAREDARDGAIVARWRFGGT